MENISLEDKCRAYQKACDHRIDTDKYIIAHIDGRSFSKMVKNKFIKPFDSRFIEAMNETAKYLCANVQGVQFAYVQSDEISLLIKKNTPESDVFFGGRLCKMQSIMASLATCRFNQFMAKIEIGQHVFGRTMDIIDINKIIDDLPLYQFDCKVWTVDNQNDAWAWFLFRNIDCVRNSKQQYAQAYASHKELLGKTCDEQIAFVKGNGHDWNDCRRDRKFGRIIAKENYTVNAVNPKTGNTEESIRTKWTINEGYDLTSSTGRIAFYELCPSLAPVE